VKSRGLLRFAMGLFMASAAHTARFGCQLTKDTLHARGPYGEILEGFPE
jgi:hypothetical protein